MSQALDSAYYFMISLLYDEGLRRRFAASRVRVLAEYQLSPEQAMPFMTLDLKGLNVDARLRRRYLMSSLCRAFPLTCGALGAASDGAEYLARFMASPALTRAPGPRNLAFADFLNGLIDGDAHCVGPEVNAFLKQILAWERALVVNAQAMRQVIRDGGLVPPPHRGELGPDEALALPPHFVAAILPASLETLKLALHHIGPGDAWERIEGGGLNIQRVVTVARAKAMPVTMLARGVVDAQSEETPLPGVDPLVNIHHITAELAGEQGVLLAQFDGERKLADLNPPEQKIARQLRQAGLI